jgi:dsDNA-binding SOS-regulon protein
VVWDKVKELAAALREALKNPLLWKSLETVAGKFELWMAKSAPQALEALRNRLQEVAAGKKKA